MNRFWIVLGVVVLALVGLFFATKKDVPSTTTVEGDAKTILASDHVRGGKVAKVTLIEYGDFQCPACGSYYPIVKQLETIYAGKVNFVFRHFPLIQIHPNAFAAARAAEAAGNQGKFFEMHDKLYETQRVWGETTSNQQSLFEGYAQELDLNMDQFKKDYASNEVADRINQDLASGQQTFGIDSTPSFILDGTKLTNPKGLDDFKNVLDKAITNASN